ncbi:hypothetical protein [Sporohalobacter salinus]|uniref:hypothetical protein n=1 Tax=Sporohalobacter salinus TaxID=1494606 RepID=UPI00195FF0FB|nr:hypothetical protein [Sporohalobacter salinus]MBM7623672.1 hypothetical protein [Sporohalobacter salinus]
MVSCEGMIGELVIKRIYYYTLKDRIVTKANLYLAVQTVISNGESAGIDGVTIEEFCGNYQ